MLEAVGAEGYDRASVRSVLERTDLYRQAFYDNFADKEDCYLQAYDRGCRADRNGLRAAPRGRRARGVERLRAGLGALLDFLEAEPDVGRALLVEVHAAGAAALAKRDAAVARGARLPRPRAAATALGRAAAPAIAPEAVASGIHIGPPRAPRRSTRTDGFSRAAAGVHVHRGPALLRGGGGERGDVRGGAVELRGSHRARAGARGDGPHRRRAKATRRPRSPRWSTAADISRETLRRAVRRQGGLLPGRPTTLPSTSSSPTSPAAFEARGRLLAGADRRPRLRALVELLAGRGRHRPHGGGRDQPPSARTPGSATAKPSMRFVPLLEQGRAVSPQGARSSTRTPPSFAIGAAASMIFDEIRAGRGPRAARRSFPNSSSR